MTAGIPSIGVLGKSRELAGQPSELKNLALSLVRVPVSLE